PGSRFAVAAATANLALNDGRWDDVPITMEGDGAAMGAGGLMAHTGHRSERCYRMGDRRGAAELYRRLASDVPESTVMPLAAWADWLEGERVDAAEGLRTWADEIQPHLPAALDTVLAAGLSHLAADLRLAELCSRFAGVLRPHRGKWGSGAIEMSLGLVDHALGLCDYAAGRPDEGEAELRAAIADYRRAGTRASMALALADLARLAGDGEARAEASSLGDELGMGIVPYRLGD
ncbi:MAG: hypothetical protein AAGK32_20745, partial [Actinomycetota bacterium]